MLLAFFSEKIFTSEKKCDFISMQLKVFFFLLLIQFKIPSSFSSSSSDLDFSD